MNAQCSSIKVYLRNPKLRKKILHIDLIKSMRQHLRECEDCSAEVAVQLGHPLGCNDASFGKRVLDVPASLALGQEQDRELVAHVKVCFTCSDEVEFAKASLRNIDEMSDPIPHRRHRIALRTSLGMAEAVRETGKADDIPWEIHYPWGDDKFYGTASQVKARMKKNIAENDEEDAGGEEG